MKFSKRTNAAEDVTPSHREALRDLARLLSEAAAEHWINEQLRGPEDADDIHDNGSGNEQQQMDHLQANVRRST